MQKKARKQAGKTRQESLSTNLHVNKRDQYPTATPSHLQGPLHNATTQREAFTPFFGPISYTHEFPLHGSHIPPMTEPAFQNTQTHSSLPAGPALGTPSVGNVTQMNTSQNASAVSINQGQSSLPMGPTHGPRLVGNVTQMNTMQNVNAVSINQAQSSLPMGPTHGPPFIGNVTRMNTMQNVNAVSINQAPSPLLMEPARHAPPHVGNVTRVDATHDLNTISINRAQFGPQTQQSHWHSGMSPGRYELVPLPGNVVKCYGCGQTFAEKY